MWEPRGALEEDLKEKEKQGQAEHAKLAVRISLY